MDAAQFDLGEHGSDSWPEAKLRRSQNESSSSGGRSESSGSFSWGKMTFLRICFRLVSYGKKRSFWKNYNYLSRSSKVTVVGK